MQKRRRLFVAPITALREVRWLSETRQARDLERLRAMDLHAFADAWLEQAKRRPTLPRLFAARLSELIDAEWGARLSMLPEPKARRARPRLAPAKRVAAEPIESADALQQPTSRWPIEFDR